MTKKNPYPPIPDLCHCGCGTIVYGGRKFSRGHNNKLNEARTVSSIRMKYLRHKADFIKNLCLGQKRNKNALGHKLIGDSYKKSSKTMFRKGNKPHNTGKSHMVRENHPNWKGGVSFLPYCPKFNFRFKEAVRERDGRICQLCNKSEIENKKKLSVHHIHHDKENCYPDCISLCSHCNLHVVEKKDKLKYYEDKFMNNLNNRNLLLWRTEYET